MSVLNNHLLGSMILSVAILLSSSGAHAQQPQSRAGMMGHGMMGDQAMMGPMGMLHGPMLEGRIAYIKAELAISDVQSVAWNGYADTVKARAASMQGMRDTMMQTMQSGTAMARMDAHIKVMETMAEALKSLKPATETLYAVLTPEQRQKADELLGMGCMM